MFSLPVRCVIAAKGGARYSMERVTKPDPMFAQFAFVNYDKPIEVVGVVIFFDDDTKTIEKADPFIPMNVEDRLFFDWKGPKARVKKPG